MRVQTYTGIGSPVIATDDVFQICKLSYAYYCMVGVLVGLFVGLVVSFLTKRQDLKTMNPDLIAPCMRRFLPFKTEATEAPEEDKLLKTNIVKLELSQNVVNHSNQS